MKKIPHLILWIVSLELIAVLFGQLTHTSIDSWYMNLTRSSITPPGYMFGLVWTILYALIATCGWLLWNHNHTKNLSIEKKLFIIQLLLNWAWTPLFFYFHLVGVALVVNLLLLAVVFILLIRCLSGTKRVAILLTPYFLWLILAAYLNAFIWVMN